MKKLLFILLCLLSISLKGQDNPFTDVFPLVDKKVNYTDVEQIEGKSASELYKNAKLWLVDAFKSSKDVIQNDDKDNFIVVGKGFFSGLGHVESVENAKYWFTIRIDCRDGRYKYSITDFIYDFDVVYMGITTHFNKDFTEWGNISYNEYYQEQLDKKFPPNKERNEKQQKKYEQEKEKLAEKQMENYQYKKERFLLIDAQIKSTIESLKKGMKQTDDNW